MDDAIPIKTPEDFNSLLDVLKYAWVLGIYWGKQLLERIRRLEDKQNLSPTMAEVDAKLDEKMTKVEKKLDRIFDMLWEEHRPKARVQGRTRVPEYNLGELHD